MRKTIRTKTVQRKYHDSVHVVPVERIVHVATPVVTKIPVYLGTQTQISKDPNVSAGGALLDASGLAGGLALGGAGFGAGAAAGGFAGADLASLNLNAGGAGLTFATGAGDLNASMRANLAALNAQLAAAGAGLGDDTTEESVDVEDTQTFMTGNLGDFGLTMVGSGN